MKGDNFEKKNRKMTNIHAKDVLERQRETERDRERQRET